MRLRNSERRRVLPRCAAILALLALGSVAVASASELPELGPITVTATRRAQSLNDFPGSVSRIGSEVISDVGPTHHSEVMNRAPGTYIQRGSGQESLTAIRSPVLTGAGSCGAFLFLENGIPIRPTGFCNVNDMFEVNFEQAQAIEIVRGPGTALYGSSAVHGIINVLMPDASQLPAFGLASDFGPDDYVSARLTTASHGAATDLGLLGHYTHDGGWRDHSGFEEEKVNGLLEHRAGSGTLRMMLTGTNLNQDTAGFIQGFEAYKDPALAHSNANPEAFRDADSTRLSTQWDAPLGEHADLDLRAIARHSHMEFLQHFLLGKPLERNGQDSVAALASIDWQLRGGGQLTAGADAELSSSTLLEVQDHPTTDGSPAANAIRPAGRHYDYDVNAWVLALYGQLEWPLATAWTLNAGLRGEYTHYTYDNHMIAGNTDENGVPCPLGGCLYNRPADRSDQFENLAPKLGISWSFAAGELAYLNLTSGFRAPETTELYRLQRQQSVADLDSERIEGVELGLRGAAHTFTYTLAAFDMDKRNVILRDAAGFNVSNGRTSHRGVEYEFTWTIVPQLLLSGAGTVARHRYEFSRSADAGEQIQSGNDVDTAPHNLHSLRLGWLPSSALRAEVEWVRVGPYFLDAVNLHRYEGHDLFNLRCGWQIADRWRLDARVNNLLDVAYADRADFAFGNYRYFPGRERTLFFEIGYSSD
jgi:outer membrane receptor protein involved in Fe transport